MKDESEEFVKECLDKQIIGKSAKSQKAAKCIYYLGNGQYIKARKLNNSFVQNMIKGGAYDKYKRKLHLSHNGELNSLDIALWINCGFGYLQIVSEE